MYYVESNVNANVMIKDLYDSTTRLYMLTLKSGHYLDFFFAHAITSLHGTNAILQNVKLANKDVFHLLRNQYLGLLVIYAVQGLVPLHGHDTLMQKTATTEACLPDWKDIITNTIADDDEHVCKVVRAMQIAEHNYGSCNGWWQYVAAKTVETITFESDWDFAKM